VLELILLTLINDPFRA